MYYIEIDKKNITQNRLLLHTSHLDDYSHKYYNCNVVRSNKL